MNKEQLLNEINLLLAEARKLKSLALKGKPVQKTGRVLCVEDLEGVKEYFVVHSDEAILNEGLVYEHTDNHIKMGCVFYDYQSAKNYRDAIRLAHECRIAMAESWDGEEIDWDDDGYTKFCFKLERKNSLSIALYYNQYRSFAFKEYEHAQKFIDKHGEDAVINMILNY